MLGNQRYLIYRVDLLFASQITFEKFVSLYWDGLVSELYRKKYVTTSLTSLFSFLVNSAYYNLVKMYSVNLNAANLECE